MSMHELLAHWGLYLPAVWFFIVGILLTGYAILDGFDLGVGMLHLLTKTDEERRLMINTIGPVWDGNEVWLVTAGGALFAGFPDVYATVFSGFYIPFMLVLVALIFRAVAIEFRNKQPMRWWRESWDIGFALGSLMITLLFGLTIGNIVRGIPLNPNQEFGGSLSGLLNPYALLVAFTTVALFIMHASIYVVMKTEGHLHLKARKWVTHAIGAFLTLFGFTTVCTILYVPHMADQARNNPDLLAVAGVMLILLANVPREMHYKRDGKAFICSCLAITCLLALFGLEMFPNLVYSFPNPENSLTIFNAASSEKTLEILLLVTMLGIPLILAYTISIYWIFRGKAQLEL